MSCNPTPRSTGVNQIERGFACGRISSTGRSTARNRSPTCSPARISTCVQAPGCRDNTSPHTRRTASLAFSQFSSVPTDSAAKVNVLKRIDRASSLFECSIVFYFC